MSFGLNISETGRVLSVCVVLEQTPQELPRVEELPDGDVTEYRYEAGALVHDPIPQIHTPALPTLVQRTEAIEDALAAFLLGGKQDV